MANGGNRRRPRRGGVAEKLYVETHGPRPVPVSFVATFFGVFMLPVTYVLTKVFLLTLARETFKHEFWLSEEFWFFGIGAICMVITFFGMPKPVKDVMLKGYVIGHECTHAIWVLLMGGRIHEFDATAEGGHIITDRTNVWIVLSPYFYPVYSIALLAIYGILSLCIDVEPYHRWFFAFLGVTWTFHICYTLWMLPKGQTDIEHYGRIFSGVFIFTMNVVVMTLMLILASPRVTFFSYGRRVYAESLIVLNWLADLIGPALDRLWNALT